MRLGVCLWLLIAAPAGFLWASGVPLVSYAPEFVYYRMGQALSQIGGERLSDPPVQGIPSAVILNAWTWLLLAVHGGEVVAYPVVNTYAYGGVLLILALALPACLILWRSPVLCITDRLALSLAALVPWYAGGFSLALLLVPEYWLFEYAYQLTTAVGALLLLRAPVLPSWRLGVLVGAWGAVGALAKASDAGSMLLLLALVLPHAKQRREIGLALRGAVTGFLVAVPLLLNASTIGDVGAAWRTGTHLVAFLVAPNNAAATLADALPVLAQHPEAAMFVGLALVGIVALVLSRRWPLAAGALVWLAPYAYLTLKRPGPTSVASLGLMAIMLAPVLLSAVEHVRVRRGLLGLGVLLALVTATQGGPYGWYAAQVANAPAAQRAVAVLEEMRRAELGFGPHLWLMPNASSTGAAWAFAYSGQMGLHPVVLGEDGLPRYAAEDGRLLGRLFGGMLLVPENRQVIGAAFRAGWPIVWCEADGLPESDNDRWLRDALDGAGYGDRRAWEYVPGRRVVVARR